VPCSGLNPSRLRRLGEVQRKYSSLYIPEKYRPAEKIAGLDCAYRKELIACSGVLWERSGKILETRNVKGRVLFPYLSGFFAFREGPWLVALLRKFTLKPDLVFVDGNGLLHPRRAGLAVFVGVRGGLPTVGISKRPLRGLPWDCGKEIVELSGGYALCRKGWKRPIFISPGNLLSPEQALRAYLDLSPHKIPAPLRKAHLSARRLLYES